MLSNKALDSGFDERISELKKVLAIWVMLERLEKLETLERKIT